MEKILGGKIATRYETRLVKVTNKLAQEALRALQSKVPIDTGELRNNFLAIDYAKTSNLTANVGVDNGNHLGRDRRPISSFELAFARLNEGSGKRSQDSHAVSPYSSIPFESPTKGWITSAIRAFGQRKRNILNG